MFCPKCGKKIDDEARFCGNCGNEIKGVVNLKNESADNSTQEKGSAKKTSNTFFSGAAGFLSMVVGILVGKYIGILGLILYVVAGGIGYVFGQVYSKSKKINKNVIEIICWSNVLTWLLPPLGLMTGFATWQFSETLVNRRRRYLTLSIIAIILSLGNGFWGAYNAINGITY